MTKADPKTFRSSICFYTSELIRFPSLSKYPGLANTILTSVITIPTISNKYSSEISGNTHHIITTLLLNISNLFYKKLMIKLLPYTKYILIIYMYIVHIWHPMSTHIWQINWQHDRTYNMPTRPGDKKYIKTWPSLGCWYWYTEGRLNRSNLNTVKMWLGRY